MSRLSDILWDYDPQFQEPLARLREATSLALMVMAAWTVVRMLAVRLLEEVLTVRARQPETWPVCSSCGRLLQSKGFRERVLQNAVWGNPLAAAGGAVSARLCRVASGAVGCGLGVGGAPTHRGGGAVDGLSVGRVCTV